MSLKVNSGEPDMAEIIEMQIWNGTSLGVVTDTM